MKKEKIVLAMSGGVDSSVCITLLQEMGYEVIGLTFIMYEEPESNGFIDFVNEAKVIAQQFGIKHYVSDIKKDFEEQIIQDFIDSYLRGITPNPCVLCNPTMKWKHLTDFADSIGVNLVATGHYARIKHQDDRYFLSKAADEWKNQIYFLWNLSQAQLKRTIFPLGDYLKTDVKKIAAENGLVKLSQKRESYDICFVKEKDYRVFLNRKLNEQKILLEKGEFITEDGTVVGTHEGIANYTIGQRKGLGIAMGEPYYVKKINKKTNQIIIAPRQSLATNQMLVRDYNFMKFKDFPYNKSFLTKIRYRDKGDIAMISKLDDKLLVEFKNKVFGITSGQSAVFYDNNDLAGGGIIV